MTNTASHAPGERPSRARRWTWILVALGVLAGVGLYLSTADDPINVSETEEPPPRQIVSVETPAIGDETVEIRTFAEIRPRWSAQLRTAVSGRVLEVMDSALAGGQVAAGTALVKIEDSRYVAEVSAAELALKRAQLALQQAENAHTLARRDFQRNRASPPNDLALRLPQLDIAKSAVVSAQAQLAAAHQQLRDTTVTAPFSGFLTERFVSPGQTVNAGDSIVALADDQTFELFVELGRDDWKLLDRPLAGKTARILNGEDAVIAEARVRQAGGFLDETTRQYKVFLEIDKRPAEVLSGDFVQVVLPGMTVSHSLNVPEPALSQDGYVWHVDAEDRLQRIRPRVLFRRSDRIVIQLPDATGPWRIATTPLASFLPGQLVEARVVEGEG